ncbi:MAG: SRPBCC family protein [Pseudomonadota bacterium]
MSLQSHSAEIKSLDVKKEKGRYIITAECLVEAPVGGVYEVLTDYTRFSELSSMVTESRFVESDSEQTLVFTRTHGCVLFFCKTVDKTEVMEAVKNEEVVTTALPDQSTVDYSKASWQMQQEDGGTRLFYKLETDLGFWVPPVIGPLMVKRAWYSGSLRALNRLEQFALARTGVTVKP